MNPPPPPPRLTGSSGSFPPVLPVRPADGHGARGGGGGALQPELPQQGGLADVGHAHKHELHARVGPGPDNRNQHIWIYI